MTSPAISIDIGGTLAKLVIYIPKELKDSSLANYFLNKECSPNAVHEEDLQIDLKQGSIHFIKFLSAQITTLGEDGTLPGISDKYKFYLNALFATGGGAHKYEDFLNSKFCLKVKKMNELDCLVRGLREMLGQNDGCFSLLNARFGGDVGPEREKLVTIPLIIKPTQDVIVVNIGSGVSILHLKEKSYNRIGGTSLGGSTFLGLVALLTGVDSFDEALDLAANGDSTQVDMLVKDIYGDVFGSGSEDADGKKKKPNVLFKTLRPTTLAASFGKMIHKDARSKVRKEDIALSTLIMCSMNVAGIAHIYANQVGAKHIIFTGNFLATSTGLRSPKGRERSESIHLHASQTLSLHKRNTISMRILSYAVSYWSGNKTKAVFLKHEGCLGALGALLEGTNIKFKRERHSSDSKL